MTTTQGDRNQQRAAAIRATLEQVQAELDTTQRLTEEMLTTMQGELRRTGLRLAETQMELTFTKAWKGEPQQ